MSHFKGISHIGIPTQDYENSVSRYNLLGFSLINEENNAGNRVGFFELNNLLLEVYEEPVNPVAGAINHIAIETDDVDAAFAFVKSTDFELIDQKIMSLPFWNHGIRYFNFYGPNHEVLEICQKNEGSGK